MVFLKKEDADLLSDWQALQAESKTPGTNTGILESGDI